MASKVRDRISDLLRSAERHERYLALMAALSLVMVVCVASVLMRSAQAMTHKEQVLDCHYNGNGAHTHNMDCYDKSMNLVCPLEERLAHTHDESCYIEVRELICGQEEQAQPEPEEPEGELQESEQEGQEGQQEQAEPAGHQHTEDCYRVTKELICGLEEVTEEHVHGSGCFKTVTVRDYDGAVVDGDEVLEVGEVAAEGDGAAAASELDEEALNQPVEAQLTPEDDMPAQVFRQHITERDENGQSHLVVTVFVRAPKGAFPSGTTMSAALLDESAVRTQVESAVQQHSGSQYEVKRLTAVDISFYDRHGQEIEPASQVEVRLTSPSVREMAEPVVFHVQGGSDGGAADYVGGVDVVNESEEDGSSGEEDTLRFEADRF